MNEPMDIESVNKIRFVKKLAKGGMGTVYEAVQYGAEGFQKTMAVKTLLEDCVHDSEFLTMFIGEAKLVADLVHDNIAQVYQLGKYKNSFYIAMEYIHGVNLKEFHDRHIYKNIPIPEELACFIISRICRALAYAHNKRDSKGRCLGVVHRDVSPKNIMISFEGVVKLTDFGIAKARDFMWTQEGEVLYGKVPYMSPEQAAFQETDLRSDIFLLGICLYELLSGKLLYGDAQTMEILQRITQEDCPNIRTLCPNINPKLENIVNKALKKDRRERYQTAQDMCSDLEHYMYDGGYGPTNQVLERYVKTLFPEKIRF